MMIRKARPGVILAVVVLAVGSPGPPGWGYAALQAQDEVSQAAAAIESRLLVPGETVNPYGCATTLPREPINSLAVAEGEMGAADGPSTTGSEIFSPTVNPVCPPVLR
jgi:hypothetical protein